MTTNHKDPDEGKTDEEILEYAVHGTELTPQNVGTENVYAVIGRGDSLAIGLTITRGRSASPWLKIDMNVEGEWVRETSAGIPDSDLEDWPDYRATLDWICAAMNEKHIRGIREREAKESKA